MQKFCSPTEKIADANQAPHDANQAPHDTNQAPHDANQTPYDANQAPYDANQAPHDANQAPHDANHIWMHVNSLIEINGTQKIRFTYKYSITQYYARSINVKDCSLKIDSDA